MIRPARASDLEAIAALVLAEWRDTIARAIDTGAGFVAEESRILGFVTLDYAFYGRGFVTLLFVREDMRRRGIGEAPMRA